VPDQVEFATKPQIAITQLREARQSGAPNAVVLADAGYGNDAAFRANVGELGLQYAVGIQSSTRVWPPGLAPLPAVPSTGKVGRPRSLQGRVPGHDQVAVKDLALALDPSCYNTVSWREGTRAALSSRLRHCACGPPTVITGGLRRAMKNGCLSSGPLAKSNQPNIGFQLCRKRRLSNISFTLPKCAGASSVTIRISSRSLDSDTSRDVGGVVGVVSIITHPYALPPMGFSSHSA